MKILRFLKSQSKALHIILLMLLAAPMYVFAQSQTVTLLSENFGMYANNDFPEGWTKVITNSTSTVSSSNGHSASRCFKFTRAIQQSNSEYWNIVAMPYIEAEAGSMTVSFWSRPGSTNANCGTFDIGYITDVTDASTFVQVSSYDYTEGTTYKQYSVPLPNAPANALVAFRHRPLASSTSYQWFIDDIEVSGQLLPCPMTVDLSAEVTPMEGDHATLTWTERGSATNWVLQYGTDSEFASGTYTEVNNGFTVNGSTVTREITGLTSDVTYYARMKSDCGGGDYSAWSNVISFTPTDYLYIGTGTSNNGSVPTNTGNQYSLTEQLYTAAELGINGDPGTIFSIGFYNGTASEKNRQCDMYLVNTDKTSFSSNTDWITVTVADRVFSGTMTFAANGWTDIVFNTPFDYTGGNIALIFDDNTAITNSGLSCRYFNGTSNNTLYKAQNGTDLDPSAPGVSGGRSSSKNQLRVLIVPGAVSSCKRPLALQASNFGANSATLTWQANDGAAWKVEYKTAEATSWTTFTNNVSATTCNLTGLTANTDYIARVTANCDDDQWATVTFTTTCEAINTFPWTEDFEDYEGNSNTSGNIAYSFNDPCWINKRVAGSGNYLFQVTTSTQSSNATKKLVMPSSSMSGTSLELALPLMAFPAGHEYKFILDALRNTNSTTYAEEGVHILASPDGTLENATELGFISHQWNKTPVEGGYDVPAESASGWYSYEFLLPANTIRVILKGDSKGSAFYLDNFKVKEELPCKLPSDPVFVDATSTTATLSWTNGEAGQTAWQVAYMAGANFNPETDLGQYSIADVTSNPGTITGLTPLTTYYAYVRSNCGTLDYSEWSVAYCTFTTECAPVTTFPWTETFESYNSGNFSDICWVNEHVSGSSTGVFKVYTFSIGNNYTHLLQLPNMQAGTLTKLVLPEMQLQAGTDYQFCIDMYRSGSYTDYTTEGVRVFASTDGEIEGATEMAFIPRVYSVSNAVIPAEATANTWYTYRLAIPLSGSCHIILRGESQYGAATYMDNLKVRVMPTCGEPEHLVMQSTTSSTATLGWTDTEAGHTAWQIAYRANTDFDPLTDVGLYTIADVTSNPGTITGLSPQTTYYAYVRANCGNNDYSEWTATACQFTTGCGVVTDFPWSEDFESHSSGNFNDPCFVNEHISGDGTSIFQVYVGTNGTNSTHQLRLPNMSSGTYTKLVLPEMQFEAGEDYEFSIDVYRTSQSYYQEGIRIFASPDGTIESGTVMGFIPRYYSTTGTGVPYENTVGWYTYRFRIPSGTSNVILRGESRGGDVTYMDNLKVNVAPSCSYPSNLQVPSDDVMARNATIKWNAGDATEWIVEYKTQAATEYTAITGVTETPYVLTGLVPQTQYSVRVRAVCSPTEITEPTNPKTFTTKAPYDVPQRLRASNVSPAGATLTWVARDNEDHWDLFYTDSPDYEPQSYTHPQFANITANPFQLTGLEPGRTYYVYVRSNEGASGVSGWSAPCRFFLGNQLTVNDGTVTNTTVPVLGYYVNNSFNGQFIIPAEDLQGMANADISQLVFYNSASNTANIDWGDVRYVLSLSETSVTEFNSTSIPLTNPSVTCYIGSIRIIDHQMTIEFDQPYHYNGDNLRVTFSSNPSGNVNTAYAYWLGVTTENTTGYGSSYYYRSYNDYGYQSFLPKVTFSYLYQGDDYCYAPTDLQASNVTTNSATLSWTNIINDSPAWELQYRKADESEYITVEGTVTNPFTLQGLEPSYGYDVRVRAACGEGIYSDWVETWFATACVPLTSLPYSTGFEDMVYGVLPPCWSYYSNGSYAPHVSSYYTNSGDFDLELYAGEPGDVNIVVLPEIPVDAQHPMNGNELVFAVASMSYIATTLQVGVMTDPTDPESFEQVGEVALPENTGYHRCKVSFANYTGSGTYIAIRQENTSPLYSFEHFIDDIVVSPIPDCTEPTGLTVSNVTSASATLQWTVGGTETEWQVQYMPIDIYYYYYASLSVYNSYYNNIEWPETYQTVSQTACTLSDLAEGTPYVARVRAACSATETSEWSGVVPFITSCTAPFIEDFDLYTDLVSSSSRGWCFSDDLLDEVLNHTVSLSFGSAFPSTWEWGNNSLVFTNDENGMMYYSESMRTATAYGDDDHYWLISPSIEMGEGYQLNFDLALLYYQSAASGLDDNRFAVLVTTDDGATWTTLGLWDYEGTAGRNYYDIPCYPTEVNFNLSAFNNQTIRIAFYVESTVSNYNNVSSKANTIYLDNVNVTKRVKPDVVVASNVTANSAPLNWTTHGETSWTLQYRIDDDIQEWTTVNNITSLPYTLEGLQVAHRYQVRVKAHYASGDSEWSFTAVFATACEPISLTVGETYEEQFNGVMFPSCWDKTGSSSCYWSWYNYLGYEYSDMHAPTSNGSATLIMPQIEVSPGMSLTFHHSTRTSSHIQIKVRVSNNATFYNYPDYGYFSEDIWDNHVDDQSAGVTVLSLNEYAGQTVYVGFYAYVNSSNQGGYTYAFSISDVMLSIDNAFVNQTANRYWNETENWTLGVLPGVNENALIIGDAVIPSGCTVQVNEIHVANGGSLTLADGGQLKHNNAGVTAAVQKDIVPYSIAQTNGENKADGWYLIASPMQNAIEPTASLFANEYDLYRFNQSNELEWENYLQYFYLSPYFKLNNGQGYLYANSGDGVNTPVTIEWEGQLRPSNEDVNVLLAYDASAEFAGFNLIGNPFACDAYLAEVRDFYVMNAAGDELEINASQNGVIAPLQGLFVEAADADDNTVTFTTTMPQSQSQGGALTLNVYEGSALRQAQGPLSVIDRARVRFGEGLALGKFSLRPNGTRLFIPQGRKDYAVVYSDKQGEVPVNFKAADNGSYTISVSAENTEMSYLHLVDNLTGADVDLLTELSYTFDAKTTDYASRFRLVFSVDDENGASTGSETFAFIDASGNIIITGDVDGATLQVIDMMGRVLVCRDALNASQTIPTDGMTPGVYVLRLINGDNVKTQKIVIDR